MMTTSGHEAVPPMQRAFTKSLPTFYHLEQAALQQATERLTGDPSNYWTTIAEETRRVLSVLSFSLTLHGLAHLDPTQGGDAT